MPIIGNVAEHLVAVQVAMKNQMDLSLSIALGSSLQIALFVAPVLVFVSLAMGHPLTLEFNNYEVIAMICGFARRRLCGAGRPLQLVGRLHAAGRIRRPGAGLLFFLPAVDLSADQFGDIRPHLIA